MTGLQCTAGAIQDADVTECRLDLSSFRFTKLRATVFKDCSLVGADFQNADLSGTQFIGCDLEGAQFSHARMEGARFEDCVLSGVGGVASFRGAIVRSDDLLSLSRVLATALGITIEHATARPGRFACHSGSAGRFCAACASAALIAPGMRLRPTRISRTTITTAEASRTDSRPEHTGRQHTGRQRSDRQRDAERQEPSALIGRGRLERFRAVQSL
jgi:hypothetical protein